MSKAILFLNEMPKTCGDCPIFVSNLGYTGHCSLEAEYTMEEIEIIKDGNKHMYYYGYLPNRPKACPLKESEE